MIAYQLICLTRCVRPIARPHVSARFLDHSRANEIQFDITVARQQIPLRIDQTALVTTFPKCAATPVDVVYVLHVATSKVAHHARQAFVSFGRDQQVYVVRHQYIGVNIATISSRAFHETVQIEQIVCFSKKQTARLFPRCITCCGTPACLTRALRGIIFSVYLRKNS